jgi:2-(1,2-epoxy-1,2-dihydrophenyl)acetyl-CoA isomerase
MALREELGEGVLTLTLDRPEALNALDRELKAGLLAAFRRAGRTADVRAVVLTGAGRAFCAGQDLGEADVIGTGIGAEVRERYVPLILAMRRLDKPIVAAINGVAAGAGLSLALACDLRLAAQTATFACAFGRIGLVPDSGLSWFLPRLVGTGWAARLVLAGESIDAPTAERVGLVEWLVPAARLAEEAHDLAARLAAGAPLAQSLAKRSLAFAATADLGAALEFEAQAQTAAARSDDFAEGLAAFRAKRAPRFGGH